MTVLDTSGIVDFLIGDGAAGQVEALLVREGTVAVPDLVTFEVVAVFRRLASRGTMPVARAAAAIDDLGDMPLTIFQTLPLRERAWSLYNNFTTADAFFVALARELDGPLATKDSGLAASATQLAGIEVVRLAT